MGLASSMATQTGTGTLENLKYKHDAGGLDQPDWNTTMETAKPRHANLSTDETGFGHACLLIAGTRL